MADLARASCPFHGVVEVDESDFGPARVRGQRGRGAGRKTPVFGILERGGRVHCQIVNNCSKSKLQTIMKGLISPQADITSDGFRGYDGLVEAGFERHQRREAFAIFLKETEFRFNNRSNDLYKILLKSCRLNPLRAPQLE
jgi:transposase-like protein